MPLFDHFNFLAPLYEIFIPPKYPEEMCALLGLPVSGALLDAGGGTGRVAQFLVGQADPIVVADLSCRMLAEARRKSGLHPVCSHTERLPFPDGSFARIIMVDAFHHVCNQRQTAEELWRVLQPGGRLVIEEPDVRSFVGKLIAGGEKLAIMRSHFLAPSRIADLFHYPNALIRVATANSIAWIIVEKG
jgi:demethylmenaquinone methyltransferase/2-methoxy-6-polyprenyl-1,4-benzoquinol methylase